MKSSSKLKIMVSSTIYGIEELLDRVYTILISFGYEVWMSHKGTMPVFSNQSVFTNCIKAVEKCDLFLGIITPYYGSGVEKGDISISHKELQKAIQLNKPRWLLAHDNVVFARSILKNLGYEKPEERKQLNLKKNQVFNDLRVIDMYEEAILFEAKTPLRDQQGNWVQKFHTDEDALLFATAQFSRYQEVESFINENLSDLSKINDRISGEGSRP